jgi:ribosome-binding factor A
MATTHRQQRISELLKEELSVLILELTDTRLEESMVGVLRVDVSPDLHNAQVYIEHQLPASASRQVLQALQHSEGFLRRGLVERTDLRYVPHLTFHVDDTAERGRRVDELLDSISSSTQALRSDEPDNTD